ncbi:hypothetical protein HKD37_12G034678 [Glycine soja]
MLVPGPFGERLVLVWHMPLVRLVQVDLNVCFVLFELMSDCLRTCRGIVRELGLQCYLGVKISDLDDCMPKSVHEFSEGLVVCLLQTGQGDRGHAVRHAGGVLCIESFDEGVEAVYGPKWESTIPGVVVAFADNSRLIGNSRELIDNVRDKHLLIDKRFLSNQLKRLSEYVEIIQFEVSHPQLLHPYNQYEEEKLSNLENVLMQFMETSEANFKVNQHTIQNLEIQVGKLAKEMNKKKKRVRREHNNNGRNAQEQSKKIMRPATFGVILLLMLSVSMCMGRDKKTFKDQMNVRNEKFPNHENENHNPGFAYGGRSVNNHHYIPRQDFNNNDGADKIGNGSGY